MGGTAMKRLVRMALVGGVLVGLACSEPGSADPQAPAVEAYHAELTPMAGSGVAGVATVEVGRTEVRVTVSATGLEPGASVPQHVHSWDVCDREGRTVLNLDSGLTSPGEGEVRGPAYPLADGAGQVDYAASRPIAELAAALYEHRGMLFQELSFDSRTVVLFDEDLQRLACGELHPVEP
jgi:hypothetical protein